MKTPKEPQYPTKKDPMLVMQNRIMKNRHTMLNIMVVCMPHEHFEKPTKLM